MDDRMEKGTDKPAQNKNQGNTRSATFTPEFQPACISVAGVYSPRAAFLTRSIRTIVIPLKASRAANLGAFSAVERVAEDRLALGAFSSV
jgi:hypothetical protein